MTAKKRIVAIYCKHGDCKTLGEVFRTRDGRLELHLADDLRLERMEALDHRVDTEEHRNDPPPSESESPRWRVRAGVGHHPEPVNEIMGDDQERAYSVACTHGQRYVYKTQLLEAIARYRGTVVNLAA